MIEKRVCSLHFDHNVLKTDADFVEEFPSTIYPSSLILTFNNFCKKDKLFCTIMLERAFKSKEFEIWRSGEFFQNTYIVIYPDKILIVDPGLPSAVHALKVFLKNRKIDAELIKTVFITHFHMDHTGGIREIFKISDPQVCVHIKVREYITGKSKMVFPATVKLLKLWRLGLELNWKSLRPMDGKILMMPGSPWFPGRKNIAPPFPIDVFLKDGDKPPHFPDWKTIYTPGHSLDSTCLFHSKTGVIFTGDTILSTGGTAYPNPFHVSTDLLKGSLEKIKKLKPRLILPGHGAPVSWDKFSEL